MMANPFGTTFESFETPAGPVVESLHQDAYRRLTQLVESGQGHLISLRAPRAGYGKTMLLSRLREKQKNSAMVVPIHLADGRRVEGESILEELLIQLTESVPGKAGLTRLDLHTRRLFAHGLIPLVYSGEVPSQDRVGALTSLRERPTEAFDFHHEAAAIAQWTKGQYGILAPRLSSVLSKASGSSNRDTAYWIELFFRFATRVPAEVTRTSDLMESVFGRESRFRSGAGFLDGLGAFLNLISLVEPVVLVLDEMDGLSSDGDSAMRAASCLISLWESAPRVSVIISVNDDVWESAFTPRLPLGLQDRLEDIVIRLEPLTPAEAKALITLRGGAASTQVLEHLDLTSDQLYPRGLLRSAREAWNKHGLGAVEDALEQGQEVLAATTEEATAADEAPSEAPMLQVSEPEESKPESRKPLVFLSANSATSKPDSAPEQVAEISPAAPPTEFPEPVEAPPIVAPATEFPEPTALPFAAGPAPVQTQAPAPLESPFSISEPLRARPRTELPPPRPVEAESIFGPSSPFQPTPVQPMAQAPVASPPPITPPQAAPSPFQAISPPPQPEAAKRDTDAIDDLLKQFRDHRES